MMLTDRQVQLLNLLDQQIQSCTECNLCKNGRAKPYWTNNSKWVIVGEAPGKDEVDQNIPFCGRAGAILWHLMSLQGLEREQFLIINSVNCRPVQNNKNGKPSSEQMSMCYSWLKKYIYVLNPEKILMLGKHAVQTLTGQDVPIVSMNSQLEQVTIKDRIYTGIFSVHPASIIYSASNSKLLEKSICMIK